MVKSFDITKHTIYYRKVKTEKNVRQKGRFLNFSRKATGRVHEENTGENELTSKLRRRSTLVIFPGVDREGATTDSE